MGARFLLIVLLTSIIAGCYATQQIPLSSGARLDDATGVVTRSGKAVAFSATGATIRNDTLHANRIDNDVAIPTDSIAQISVRKFSVRNTAGLALGVGVIAFCAAAVLAIGNLASIN